jgi:two-component system response regulator BaeR
MMKQTTILIVEDEENIAEVLVAYCHREGFATHHLASGLGVVDYVRENPVDVLLLDIMLPEVDGFELCQQIRTFSNMAIIMVTARTEEIARLSGLQLGADDYICKPFSPKEVMARINSVLRRTQYAPQPNMIATGFQLDEPAYVARLNNKPLDFTAIEFKIFALFFNHKGRVFSRDAIIHSVYSQTAGISDRSIDNHVKNIRKKINQQDPRLNPIVAVYGVGYKFQLPT